MICKLAQESHRLSSPFGLINPSLSTLWELPKNHSAPINPKHTLYPTHLYICVCEAL